ncbi:MAG: deoxyribodipyrimidine photolyase [Longimicrobiales bacterium]
MSPERVRALNARPLRADGDYVLYWMTATRRLEWNHALDRAIEHAERLAKPLLVFEPLNAGYRWASDRLHRAVLDGMVGHATALTGTGVGYLPYVEPEPNAGRGLLRALAARACVVVTDDSPVFFTPELLAAAARLEPCLVESVDSCGLLPLTRVDRTFVTAFQFRRFLQRTLPDVLGDAPSAGPLASARLAPFPHVAPTILERWPAARLDGLVADGGLAPLPIDHSVAPTEWRGGHAAARSALGRFVTDALARYAEERNDPDAGVASGLSAWLHFGHLSAHEVFDAVAGAEGWTPLRLSSEIDGSRRGWWGMSEGAEGFIDQLVTWRELGFAYAVRTPELDRYESLPAWARSTLEEHACDRREYVYTLEEFTAAETHDELWNAAQRQLVRDGTIHNYLRMLWGKKILEWTDHPREALDIMIELNNRYALDGRDPNSYSGIGWTLGRFDRGWPERPIYGKVRSMSSSATRRKVRLGGYLARYGA